VLTELVRPKSSHKIWPRHFIIFYVSHIQDQERIDLRFLDEKKFLYEKESLIQWEEKAIIYAFDVAFYRCCSREANKCVLIILLKPKSNVRTNRQFSHIKTLTLHMAQRQKQAALRLVLTMMVRSATLQMIEDTTSDGVEDICRSDPLNFTFAHSSQILAWALSDSFDCRTTYLSCMDQVRILSLSWQKTLTCVFPLKIGSFKTKASTEDLSF
jgi:hypothetical protein